MVWACGKNEQVPYGQKGVDGRCQWGRVRVRPRLGWMDGVKVALGNRRMTVEAARLNEFHAAIFAWPCVLSDRPPMLWWLSHGERRDAVT